MILTKTKFGKDNDKSFKPRSNLFDPRLPEDKEIDAKNLQQLAANLAIHSPNSCFFAFHDPPESVPSSAECFSSKEVPRLNSPFQGLQVKLINNLDSMPFNDFYDISSPKFKEIMDFHSQSDNVLHEDEIKAINKLTIGQASNFLLEATEDVSNNSFQFLLSCY